MFARSSASGGLTAALLIALLTLAVPASARTSVPRSTAATAALEALGVNGDARAVRVFGTLATVPARTSITESTAAGRATIAGRTGVRTGTPAAVVTTPGEPVWLFYADRGPHQGFAHPGQIALVGARTGKVRLTRTLSWVPLVAGRLPAFFSAADGYEGKRFVIFDRPWPGTESAPAPLTSPTQPTEAERRAAATLAAQHACVLRLSDTLGDFFDFGRVDETRAQLGRFFNRLARLDSGFVTERYLPRLGRTPIAEAQRLIDRAGCRDLTIYAAGGAARGGSDASVVIGLRTSSGRVQWQTLSANDLRKLMRANRNVSFKLVFDAPYTGRLAAALRGEPNLAVLLASGGIDEPSFLYLPSLTGPQGLVVNPGNPQHLLEFSNGLISGLGRFAASPAEVDQGIAQKSTTFMAWMLARGANLAGSPFAGHLTSPVEILPGTTAPAAPMPVTPATPGAAVKPNHKPAGDATPQATDEDTAVSFTLGGTDADGDPLSFEITSAPAHGTLDGSGPRVTYTPAKDYAGADQLTYRVSDGKDAGDPITVALTVRPVNDAPVVTTSAGTATYTEQAAPAAVDSGLTLADVDSANLRGARVSLAPGDDVLAFTSQHGITGNWDATAGELTLTGAASVADYQAALRSVTFATPGDDPSTATRTISFRVDDGQATDTQSRELTVIAVDDAPVLATTSAGPAAYTEDDPAAAVDPKLTLSDPDSSSLNGATVTIGAGEGTDRLDFSAPNGITGSFAGGKLTLSGSASTADYQAALRSVGFHTVSETPSTTTRQFSFQAGASNVLTRALTVAAHDDAPTVTTSTGSASFTEGGAPAPVDNGVTVADPENGTLVGATVTIAAPSPDDTLALPAGPIAGSYSAGVLTLTGAGTAAQYQQALRSVTYSNSSHDPSSGRTLTFVVGDAGGASAPATRTVSITAVNDAPVLTTPSTGSASYTEGDSPVAVEPGLTVVDADSASLTGATVTIGTGRGATDVLAFTPQTGITGSYADGALTLTGSASKSLYETALRSVTFESTGDDPGAATRTISFVASDGSSSTPVTRNVTVTPVNDAPTVTTSAGHSAWTEGDATAAQVDSAVTVTDPDSDQLTSARVELTNPQAGDALTYTPAGAVNASYSAGVVTFTGADTPATYQAVLRSVRFANSTTTPGATTRHFVFRVGDGALQSADTSKDLDVNETNSKPVVQTSAGSAAFTEDAGAVFVDSGLTVTDADSPTLAGAEISITNGFDRDTLTYTAPGGNPVTQAGTFDPFTHTLRLTGTATRAEYQQALRAVRFATDSDTPSTATRTVRFTVDDGSSLNHLSDPADRTVTVTPANDAPAVTTTGGATPYPERAAPTVIDAGVAVTDPDSPNLAGATVTIKTGKQTGDALSFTTPASGINASVNAGGDIVTFAGAGSVAEYQAALRGVKFESSNNDPTASRTIAFTVTDGSASSPEATKAIAVGSINDAPVVTTSTSATSYAENGVPVTVDGALAVTDADSPMLQGATVSITGNFRAGEDVLSFTDAGPITGVYSGGVLTLSGSDTVANYRDALRAVKYSNSSDDPASAQRAIAFRVDDGTDASNVATKSVDVTPVNDAPAVRTTAGATTFTEGDAATIVDTGVAVADPDDTSLTGATVAISGDHAEDVLAFTPVGNITGAYSAGVLTLTGGDTLANYQTALRSVRYSNASDGPGTLTRTVTFTVDDGGLTGSATKDLKVVGVNDAPILSPTGSAAFTENATATPVAADAVAVAPNLLVTDVDSSTLSGATVEITGNFLAGEDVLSFADTANITGAVSAGKLTLSGSDTVANYQAALRTVRYRDTSNAPDTSARTIRFIADDGGTAPHTSAPLDRTVTVVATNDNPIATAKSFNAIGNTTLRVHDPANGATPAVNGPSKDVTGNLTTGASDPDGPTAFTIVPVTGQATTGGGTVDLLADGDFVHHPKAGFTGSDTFTYSVSDPAGGTGSATVTIDVQTVVWYAKSGATTILADGRSDHPFPTVGSVNAASAAAQTIFAYPGTYAGGLRLKANQQLLSKRHGLTISGTVLEAAGGTATQIDDGVVLASGNTIQGVDFGPATGFALSGDSVGTTKINTVTSGKVDNPSGGAVGISGSSNALAVRLSTINAAGNVSLTDATGSFDAGDGGLARVILSGGSLDFTLGARLSAATGRVVDITGQTGGTKFFNGSLTTGAVLLGGNTGGTVRFDGPLNLSTGGADAFTATGTGSKVVATAAANVIATTTGRALNINGATIGAEGLKFQKVSTSGADQGIVLSNTGTLGTLTVTGTGGTCTKADQSGCTGGTIAGGTGGGDDAGATPAGTGIVLNNTLAPSLTRMYVHDFSNYAIRGTNVKGFQLLTSVVSGTNGSNGASPYRDASMRFDNLTGSASITDSYIAGGAYDNVRVTNDTGTLNRLTVLRSEFGANGTSGNDGLNVESILGSPATLNVTVDRSTFTSAAGDLFQATIDGNGGGDLQFTDNVLSNNHPAIASGVGGVTLEGARGGDTSMTVTGNSTRDARGQAFLIVKGQGNRTLSGTVANNIIGVAGAANSGSLEGNGIEVTQNGGGLMRMSLLNNQIRQYNGDGIHLQAGAGAVDAGGLSVAVSGNTLSNPGTNSAITLAHQGLHLNSGVTPGDNFDVCLDLGANSMTGSGTHGGTDFRLRQRQSTRVKLPGYGGGAFDTAAVTSFVQSELGGAPTGAATTDTAGEGFVGGTSCP